MEKDVDLPAGRKKAIGFAILVSGLVGLVVASFVLATDIILILFLGLLFGIFLHFSAKLVASKLPLSREWCLGLVTATFLLLAAGGTALFGLQIGNQVETAMSKLDEGAKELTELAGKNASVRAIIQSTPYAKDLLTSAMDERQSQGTWLAESDSRSEGQNVEKDASPKRIDETRESTNDSERGTSDDSKSESDGSSNLAETNSDSGGSTLKPIKTVASQAASVVGKIFSTTLGLVVNSVLIFFTGLFIATDPETYRDGVVRLFPKSYRTRAREIMDEMGQTMWKWLLGRFGSMLITGVGAAIILWLLGVPMAISLGIATGLLAFIPNIGGAIAFLFAFLVAMSQGFSTAIWLIPAYLGLQLIESYVATPLIQQNQVSIPPGLLIAFQAVMGVIFGFLGAAVASPMLAAIKVGIEEAYVKDVLEEPRGDESDEDQDQSTSEGRHENNGQDHQSAVLGSSS